MVSNLVTPPDIVTNNLSSVLLVDPDQTDLDAVVRFCQYADQVYNVYVYTPNMDNITWLQQAVDTCDTVIVNSRSDDFKHLCLLDKTYYYGEQIYLGNSRRITDPLHFFATQANSNK
jgi:polygalacturonase